MSIELRPWQEEAYKTLTEKHFNGVLKVASGKGKTVLGIKVLEHFLSDANNKALVVVPTINLMFQWQKELKRFLPNIKSSLYYGGKKSEAGQVILSVINSASRCDFKTEFKIKILDEIHHYGAQIYSSIFSIKTDHTIGLSATPQRDDEGQFVIDKGAGNVVYTLDHADELIDHFSIWSIRTKLTMDEYQTYTDYQLELSKLLGVLASSYGVSSFKSIEKLAKKNHPLALKVLSYYSKQAKIRYNAVQKIDIIKEIVDLERGQKIIIFTESIESSETIGKEVGSKLIVHSQMSKQDVLNKLERFRNSKEGILIAPRLIDEGYDVPDASVAIIASFSRSARQMIQRDGRVLRFHNKEYARRYALIIETIEEEKYYSILERTKMTDIALKGKWLSYEIKDDENFIEGFVDDVSFKEGFTKYLTEENGFESYVAKKLDGFEKDKSKDPRLLEEKIELYNNYSDVVLELVKKYPGRWESLEVVNDDVQAEHMRFNYYISAERRESLIKELRQINARLQLPHEFFNCVMRFLDSESFTITNETKDFVNELTSMDNNGIWPDDLFKFLKYIFAVEISNWDKD